jgi:hypothetical protein
MIKNSHNKVLQQQASTALFNLIDNYNNSQQIAGFFNVVCNGDHSAIKSSKIDILKRIILNKDSKIISDILRNENTPIEIKQDIVDLLSDVNTLGGKNKKDLLTKASNILFQNISYLASQDITLPLTKMATSGIDFKNNINLIETLPTKNICEVIQVLNKQQPLSISTTSSLLSKITTIQNEDERKRATETLIDSLVSKRGIANSTRPINSFKEDDIKIVANVFACFPELYTDKVKRSLKQVGKDTTFNEIIARENNRIVQAESRAVAKQNEPKPVAPEQPKQLVEQTSHVSKIKGAGQEGEKSNTRNQ